MNCSQAIFPSVFYEIIIFTSAPKNYADRILNKIDIQEKYISHRLYRMHTTYKNGEYIKDLKMIGRDLNKMVIVDNKKENAKFQMKNFYLLLFLVQYFLNVIYLEIVFQYPYNLYINRQ